MPAPEPPTMRERYRAQVRHEVKQAALRQLAESGPAGVPVPAIGKQLGVSGPARFTAALAVLAGSRCCGAANVISPSEALAPSLLAFSPTP
jgi:hypothetical protein